MGTESGAERDPGSARALHRPRALLSPLGRGFLTGKVNCAEQYSEGHFRRTDPRRQCEGGADGTRYRGG
jgi:hypothetical protein